MFALSLLPLLFSLAAANPLPDTVKTTPSKTLAARHYDPTYWMMPGTPVPDASADPNSRPTWLDPYGQSWPQDTFTFTLEVDRFSVYVGNANGSFTAGSFNFCQLGIPQQIMGKDMIYVAGSENLLRDKLYIHRGNGCKDPDFVQAKEAFNDDWVIWKGDLINPPVDSRCKNDIQAQNWDQNMNKAIRCVIKRHNAPPKPKPKLHFNPTAIKFKNPQAQLVHHPKGWKVPDFDSSTAPAPAPSKPAPPPPPKSHPPKGDPPKSEPPKNPAPAHPSSSKAPPPKISDPPHRASSSSPPKSSAAPPASKTTVPASAAAPALSGKASSLPPGAAPQPTGNAADKHI